MWLALTLAVAVNGDMYDLLSPTKLPPAECPSGCARWAALASDGAATPQNLGNRLFVGDPPAGAACAQPGRAVLCCNEWDPATSGVWPDCRPIGAAERARRENATRTVRSSNGSSAVGDSPLCYPSFPSSGPGFDGAFCWCKRPAPGAPAWGRCRAAPRRPQQLNIQAAGVGVVGGVGGGTFVVSFTTFGEPAIATPIVEFWLNSSAQSKRTQVKGVTHAYSLNATGTAKSERIYFMSFVKLENLPERTAFAYRVRASERGEWSHVRSFRSLYSSGATKLALFGDMGCPLFCLANLADHLLAHLLARLLAAFTPGPPSATCCRMASTSASSTRLFTWAITRTTTVTRTAAGTT